MISVKAKQDVEVEIGEYEIKHAAIELVKKKFKLNDEYWLDSEGNIMSGDQSYHGSPSYDIIRKASKREKEAFKLLELLEKL